MAKVSYNIYYIYNTGTVRSEKQNMFGYVTPYEPELRVKEQRLYKSVYCGLCKSMGKRVCSESRMTLSYDMVFLALLRFLLVEERLEFEKGRCAASPFKKKVFISSNPTLEYCGAAGALLAYHNVRDDVNDKKGSKKLFAKLLLSSFKRMKKKAALPELDKVISLKLDELNALEKTADATPDMLGSKFGELLSEVFSYEIEGSNNLIAREIGYHIGKWIYVLDAADDYEKDKKRGEFNPIDEFVPERIESALNLELEAVSRAFELITPYDEGIMSIVSNILYLGMPHKAKNVISRTKEITT